MTKQEKKFKDGIILWLAYHLFDWLRQISIFQQIRNISKRTWNYKFKRNHPHASKEEYDNAWKEHRPFVFGYLFPELWVIFNILFAIVGCVVAAKSSGRVISVFFIIYAFLRTFELFVYQINVLLFDPIRSGLSKYRIKSATRMILLLICNIFEYVLWFSVVYIFMYKAKGRCVDGFRVVLESISTLTNISSPNDFADLGKEFDITLVAYIESVIGIFMNIVCLARFISLLPPVQTIDEN